MTVVITTPATSFKNIAFDDQLAVLVTGLNYMDDSHPIIHVVSGSAFEVAKWIANTHSYRQFNHCDSFSDLDEDVTSVQDMFDDIDQRSGDGCDDIQMTITVAR